MELKVYIDRLKEGSAEKFTGQVPSSFLDLGDRELVCTSPITLKGEAYLASDHLIIKLDIKTSFMMPCLVCNEMTHIDVHVPDFTHAEPLSSIPGSIFDISDLIREDILVQLPQFIECNGGSCPEREEIKKYLKQKKEEGKSKEAAQVHFPFSNL